MTEWFNCSGRITNVLWKTVKDLNNTEGTKTLICSCELWTARLKMFTIFTSSLLFFALKFICLFAVFGADFGQSPLRTRKEVYQSTKNNWQKQWKKWLHLPQSYLKIPRNKDAVWKGWNTYTWLRVIVREDYQKWEKRDQFWYPRVSYNPVCNREELKITSKSCRHVKDKDIFLDSS